MTVQEFVTAVTRNPNLLQLEMAVVTGIEKVDGGQLDGAPRVRFKAVTSAVGGTEHLFLFSNDPEFGQIVRANLKDFPIMTIIGPTPDSLQW